MRPVHKSTKVKSRLHEKQKPASSSTLNTRMLCPIFANLHYERTEGSNEHAKSKSNTKQKNHQTLLLLCLDESITLRSGAGISQR